MIEDPFYLALFGEIVNSLRDQIEVRAEGVITRSLNVGECHTLPRYLNARLLARLITLKWLRLYGSFLDACAYSSTSLKPWSDLVDLVKAHHHWRSLDTRVSLLGLSIDGVPVGDLVNDSYLRFRPSETVNLRDRYLLGLIWQAFKDARRAFAYFGSCRPKLYLASYSTYIQHGVAVRIAIRSGVPVISFGNYQEFSKQLTEADWLHTKNSEKYASEFELLSDPPGKLAEAQAVLSERLRGVKDSATAYMKVSAYDDTGEAAPDLTGNVVVFLHDFYDSPHVYYDLVFPDFWDWICFTIETLDRAGIPFAIKPHPNQIDLSADVLERLCVKYPDARVLPQGTSNLALVAAGMACAVTVYGTIAHEMAYLGVPTISCARHPHTSFSFSVTARTKNEYRQALEHALDLPFDPVRARKDSLRFFYMHNQNLSIDEQELRNASLGLRLDECGEGADGSRVEVQLRRIRNLPAFIQFVDRCRAVLLS